MEKGEDFKTIILSVHRISRHRQSKRRTRLDVKGRDNEICELVDLGVVFSTVG
jgi:hypothetical protein